MKALIQCFSSGTEWVSEFFPGYPAYLLRFANKPYLEYQVDLCILAGIREIRIVTDFPTSELREYFGNGEKWGVRISWAVASPSASLHDLLHQNSAFCASENLLLISGMIEVVYDKHSFPKLDSDCDFSVWNGCCHASCGWYLLSAEQVEKFPDDPGIIEWKSDLFSSVPVDSIQRFYTLSMDIIHKRASCYNLPGYGDTASFMVGRDVEIPKTAEIETPVIFGNSVRLGQNVVIGAGTIVGDNTLIDNNATLRETIVMGNSYVGCNLELENKICFRNYLIDPEKGVKLDIVDEFLLTQLVKSGYWRCPFTQRLVAALMLIFYAIPFLLFRPFLRIQADEVLCYMNQQRKRKLKLHLYVRPPDSFSGRYFMKFSLDRYHLLPLVLTGQLRLVGSYILEATEENARVLQQFPDYAPGIFSYSEYLQHDKDPFQREIDELYYMYHASYWENYRILKGILFRNLLKQT